MIARDHQFGALRMTALDDRLIGADALHELLRPRLPEHRIEPGQESCLERLVGGRALEKGIAKIEPALRNPVRRNEIGIVGDALLGPEPRDPAVLRIDEFPVARQDEIVGRRRIAGEIVSLQQFDKIRHRGDDDVGEMAPDRLFGEKAFGGILRADVERRIDLDERVTLLEKREMA
jgi:hypothetical protein